MNRMILVVILIFCCIISFGERMHTASIAVGNVTQMYEEGGVKSNFSATGLGICYAGLMGTPFGFYYDTRYYFLPFSVRYGDIIAESPGFGDYSAIEATVGVGYMHEMSKRLAIAVGGGVHLALPFYFDLDGSLPSLPLTLSLGVGVMPMVRYKLTDRFALFAGVNAAYDFLGFDLSSDLGISGPEFANSGFAFGANAGIALTF